MRPHLLELTAFGPYAGTVRIDFGELAAHGLFLVHGPTGAGKTSLLDGMTYALYGGVAGTRRVDRLRSDHADPHIVTAVAFEFGLHGEDYRVTRTPPHERAKKTGAGMTQQKAKATLSVRRAGAWDPLADGVEDVGSAILGLLGLNREQFTQVVVLPQGDFARALQAGASDRRRLLSSLFRTGRFEQYTQALVRRANQAEDSVEALTAAEGRLLTRAQSAWQPLVNDEPPDGASVAALASRADAAAGAAASAATAAAAAARSAAAALEAARTDAQRLRRAEAARATLDELSAADAEIGQARRLLAAAERAQSVGSCLDAADETAALQAVAADRLEAAIAAVRSVADDHPTVVQVCVEGLLDAAADPLDAREVDRARDALTTVLGTFTAAAARLDQLRDARAAERTAQAAARSHARAADDARERASGLEAARKELAERIATQRQLADAAPVLAGELQRLERAAAGAEAAQRLREDATGLQAAVTAAREAHNAALSRQRMLLEQRIEQMAGELAGALVAGEPCAVCGSAAHPAPASAAPDAVSAVALRRAAADADETREAVARAETALAGIHGELTEAVSAAGEDAADPPAAARHRDAAAVSLARARDAGEAVQQLVEELAAAEHAVALAVEEVAAHRAGEAAETAAARAVAGEAQRLSAALAEQLGEGVDPARALTGVTAVATEVEELAEAARAVEHATADDQRARARLRDALGEHDFADTAAARDARLPADQLHALRVQLREVDDRVAAARATLSECGAGDGPAPDVTALTRACEEADAAAAAAQIRLGALRQAADELRRLSVEADEVAGSLATARKEADRLRRVADICSGTGNAQRMSLERYVLAAYFEEIAEAASVRLRAMTAGRYTLRHSDERVRGGGASGLSITVYDAYTGTERDAGSLSGGETFQASLCLALAVAEVVQRHAGGVVMDTLFVDEGFGALDADSLEQAMAELDALREGGRLVGVISHVPALRERITAGIAVTKTSAGSDARAVSSLPV